MVGIIYIFTSPQHVKSNMYKVGLVGTTNPKRIKARLRELSCGNPDGFFLKTWEVNNPKGVEKAIHMDLKSKNFHHKREWFKFKSQKEASTYVGNYIHNSGRGHINIKRDTSSLICVLVNSFKSLLKFK